MKWWHKTAAGGLEIRQAVTQAADALEDKVTARYSDNERFVATRARSHAILAGLRHWSAEANTRKDEQLARVGATPAGQSVGAALRRTAQHAGRLPVLSTPMDVIIVRNGLDSLIHQLREQPDDPQRHLWLAEGLLRVERDLRAYAIARGVVRPKSLVIRAGLRIAASLGQQDQPPAARLLRRTFELAVARLRHRPDDAVALHVLARIYLIQDLPDQAVRFAKLAVLADQASAAESLVTLARSYARAGLPRNAKRAANLAIDDGQSLGYETLAAITREEHASRGLDGAQPRMAAYTALMRLVRPADRERYEGVGRDRIDTARTVLAVQWDKTKATAAHLGALTTRKAIHHAR